ncbi:MAG: hypothetical protein QM667_06235 [Asticcacaulis sp.]
MKILFSNLGYATGISGSLFHHVTRAYRHVYKSPAQQQAVLSQFRQIIDRERPDLCCMVELEQGALHSGGFNQIAALMCQDYRFHDVADKYGPNSRTAKLPFHAGKSNGFLALRAFAHERLYFRHGAKRLIYRVDIADGLSVLFCHFSLKATVRQKQFAEMRDMAQSMAGEVIILADFNTLNGLQELKPLIEDGALRLMNLEDQPTFTFHKWRHTLDLCLCTPGVAARVTLEIIPQSFSDHHALLVTLG